MVIGELTNLILVIGESWGVYTPPPLKWLWAVSSSCFVASNDTNLIFILIELLFLQKIVHERVIFVSDNDAITVFNILGKSIQEYSAGPMYGENSRQYRQQYATTSLLTLNRL